MILKPNQNRYTERKPQVSVIKIIARAMFFILLLSVMTAGITTLTLLSSLDDAGIINVSGSLRMQSYRLAYDIETNSAELTNHLQDFENSINSTTMKSIDRWITPNSMLTKYTSLIQRWHELQPILRSEKRHVYLTNVASLVNQIDQFVSELQKFSELKLKLLIFFYVFIFTLILIIAFYTIFYTRKKVVLPLTQLVTASQQIQHGNFRIQLVDNMENELGLLANAFNNMTSELEKLYSDLEDKVKEKTRKLKQANTSLKILYGCSQKLSVSYLGEVNFRNILKQLLATEGLTAVRLIVEEGPDTHWNIEVGISSLLKNWHRENLSLDNGKFGYLEWQNTLPCPDHKLIRNVAQIIARGIYYNRAQKQKQQLLLMEERTIIARELHDSIAQSLSYLKIQAALLNRSLTKSDIIQAETTANIIDQQLSVTYTQLRELLSTFRLTIDKINFGEALKELLVPLANQTSAELVLNNEIASVSLKANNQVHVLQIIREAVLNAIKHAKATQIIVCCVQQVNMANITITDNGRNFCMDTEKLNHYGIGIMKERAEQLGGQLKIEKTVKGGCQVTLLFPIQK